VFGGIKVKIGPTQNVRWKPPSKALADIGQEALAAKFPKRRQAPIGECLRAFVYFDREGNLRPFFLDKAIFKKNFYREQVTNEDIDKLYDLLTSALVERNSRLIGEALLHAPSAPDTKLYFNLDLLTGWMEIVQDNLEGNIAIHFSYKEEALSLGKTMIKTEVAENPILNGIITSIIEQIRNELAILQTNS